MGLEWFLKFSMSSNWYGQCLPVGSFVFLSPISTSSRSVVKDMFESILPKEPGVEKNIHEALADPPAYLVKEWQVPITGSELSYFSAPTTWT